MKISSTYVEDGRDVMDDLLQLKFGEILRTQSHTSIKDTL